MVDGNQNVEERKIGIYTGQVWHSDLTLKADFDVSRLSELNAPNITLGKPFIVISVGDARGIGVVKAPELNGTTLTIEPGTGLEQGGQGVHIPLTEGNWLKQNLKLNMALNLSGTRSLSVVPTGRNSELTLTSNWPHPSFLGDFLPAKRRSARPVFRRNGKVVGLPITSVSVLLQAIIPVGTISRRLASQSLRQPISIN